MRLIATLKDVERARRISALLTKENIHNQLDSEINADWGNDDYGNVRCDLWIIDEDHFAEAQQIVNKYIEGPLPPQETVIKAVPETEKVKEPPSRFPKPLEQPLGYVTFYLILACSLIFLMTKLTDPSYQPPLPKLPYTPMLSSPTKKALLYDYPKAYEIVDELVSKYGIPALTTPDKLPPEGQKKYISVFHTPIWDGYYSAAVAYLQHKQPDPITQGPLFEKLREGEFWRLLTPIFLHSDIFHILFNMLWLVVLGRQMEQRIGPKRLLLFVVLTGIFSNTCQYFMSGSDFIGFSGVLCAMLAFIWQRQRVAPWEGYQVQSTTLNFMFWFIGGMAALQAVSFVLEVTVDHGFIPGIANTAHISGLLIGYLLSRWPLFYVD